MNQGRIVQNAIPVRWRIVRTAPERTNLAAWTTIISVSCAGMKSDVGRCCMRIAPKSNTESWAKCSTACRKRNSASPSSPFRKCSTRDLREVVDHVQGVEHEYEDKLTLSRCIVGNRAKVEKAQPMKFTREPYTMKDTWKS